MQQRSPARSLRSYLNRRPFKPFVIEFVDGERVVVERPDSVRYDGQGTAVYFGKRGELKLFDHDGVSRVTSGSPATPAT